MSSTRAIEGVLLNGFSTEIVTCRLYQPHEDRKLPNSEDVGLEWCLTDYSIKMKILTWNINGIRACKIPLKELFSKLDADVICLQETKITRDQLGDDLVSVDGYSAYFSFSKKRSGYSGVATYCSDDYTPTVAEEGLTDSLAAANKQECSTIGCYGNLSSFSGDELQLLDAEGRTIITQHSYRYKDGSLGELVIINVYCPRADHENPERVSFKMRFYRALQIRAEAILKSGKSVVIVGDVNASHRRIDHCDPSDDRGHFESHPSRRWLDGFIKDVISPSASEDESPSQSQDDSSTASSNKTEPERGNDHPPLDDSLQEGEDHLAVNHETLFVDTFRFFHPRRKNAFTCWSTVTGARQTNFGTRIDYIIADEKLCMQEFEVCDIMPEFEGSDHCPVKAILVGSCSPAPQLHPLCAKFMPEFAGKQQKLSSFFQKVSPSKKASIHQKTISGGGSGRRDSGMSAVHTKRGGAAISGQPSKKTKISNKVPKAGGNIASFFMKKSGSLNQKQSEQQVSTPVDSQFAESCDTRSVFDATENPLSQNSTAVSSKNNHSSGAKETSNTVRQEGDSSREQQDPPGGGTDPLQEPKPKAKPQLTSEWRNLLRGPPPAPKCRGHKETCLLRTVKKAGPNLGKQFFVCRRPEGHKSNPEARCNHFEWVTKR